MGQTESLQTTAPAPPRHQAMMAERQLEEDCVSAFVSGNKRVVKQLLPHTRLRQADLTVVRTTFQLSVRDHGSRVVAVIGLVSLLHIAAYYGWTDMATVLVSVHNCSANWKDGYGHVPLHYAALNGHLEVVRYLTVHATDRMAGNWNGLTPLHFACHNGHLNIVQYLISEVHCNPSYVDNTGTTPLHYACNNGHLNIVQYLISEAHCNPSYVDEDSATPLHYACINGHLNIVQYLISEAHCNPSCEDQFGDTLLHYACCMGHLNIVQYLISEAHCNPSCVGYENNSPLHVVCRYGHLNIVQYLVSEVHCNPLCQDILGNTPLHCACRYGHLNIVQYLIREVHCNPSCVDAFNATPLHVACFNGHFQIVQYLIREAHCNPLCQDGFGNTPLHKSCCYNTNLNIIQYLISELHCNPSCVNFVDETPLHNACLHNQAHIVQYLLSTGLVNPLAKSKHGSTPLSLATCKYDIIKLLQPFTDNSRDYPVHTFTKVILTGDSGAGKTTIAQLIALLAGRCTVDHITDVQRFTAGIVPHHIESELGNFIIYDFAGQQEYYSSHAAILEQVMRKSAAMFICVVDLSKSNENICESLQYWLRFINNACSTVEGKSHVAIVGSHADLVQSSKEMEEKRLLLYKIATVKVRHQEYAGFVTMDCRQVDTATSRYLISQITHSQEAISASYPSISIYCHVLYAFLCTKLNVVGCTLQRLTSAIADENDSSLPTDPSLLSEYLTTLSDKSLILFLKQSKSSWIVVKTKSLLKEINGTLFAPRHFSEHRDLASNTGIVPVSNLHKVFPHYNTEMLIGFLESLDFCRSVDHSVLQYTNLQTTTPSHSTADHLLFFPGLIQSERPDRSIWQETLQFGWCLGCMDEYQFLSSRFLHVLLLSVAYKFSLAYQYRLSSSLSGLQRMCTVWRNGIYWRNDDNITTVVELINNNRWVVVAMTYNEKCPVKFAKLRGSLITLVRHLQQQYCAGLDVYEFLISPHLIQQYPFDDLPNTALFEISLVARSILCQKEVVLSYKDGHNSLRIQLLHFEPYHLLTPVSVCQLFNPSMSDQPVPATLLHKVVKFCHHSMKPQVYSELREYLDSLSIFAGRNPLEVAKLKEEDLPSDTFGDLSSILSIDDLCEVKRFLENVIDWQSLGLELGLPYPTLKRIEKEQRENISGCMMEMLAAWLKQQNNASQFGAPSWSGLQTALRNIRENELADRITFHTVQSS